MPSVLKSLPRPEISRTFTIGVGKPLRREHRTERPGVLLATSVGVAVGEREEHLLQLSRVRRIVDSQFLRPVLAVDPQGVYGRDRVRRRGDALGTARRRGVSLSFTAK